MASLTQMSIKKKDNISIQLINENIHPSSNSIQLITREKKENFSIQLNNKNIYPLSYSIPEIKIRKLNNNFNKFNEVSPMIPGKIDTYIYDTEKDYYDQYENSKYALTYKKGGWDCLRHYEILASNSIPLFKNLENCPLKTLKNFPKEILIKINKEKDLINENEYYKYLNYLHDYTKTNLTCKSSAKYLLKKIITNKNKKPKILMINNNLLKNKDWVNYSQNLISIGLRNVLEENFIDYPKNDILYENYVGKEGYGKGFTYSKVLKDIIVDRTNIKKKIYNKEYDFIIYGLMGKDEKDVGDIRINCPLWNEVSSKYNKNEIIFIYGGDKMHSIENKEHLNHLLYHSNFGVCFVRELDM